MPALTTALAEILSTVQRPGDFYTAGATEVFAPGLEVEGVGVIALPLVPHQAAELIAMAQRAPFGRGEETLVDTEVRRVWQIAPDKVHIHGRSWARSLEAIVARAAEGLGVAGAVEAEFYKLLVYDQGSFFVSHRDTEKAPGMFATLVVVLPSLYTGGELVVRHKDRAVTLEMRAPDPSEVAFAAFYADCPHEVLPVTSGCRLTLVYNLLRREAGHVPQPPSYTAEQDHVTTLLRQWAETTGEADDQSPRKVIYPLEHAYTPAELSFAALKGADAAAAAVLSTAAQQAECALHLALVSIEESGTAEHTGAYPSRGRWRSDEDDDDYEIDEVYDRVTALSDWRLPDGGQPDLGTLPFQDDELCPPDVFKDVEPDELDFNEATGNEGASFARTYSRAALVLWPRAGWLAVLNQAGQQVTLPYLAELAARWAESGQDAQSLLWRQAHELSGYMLRAWQGPQGYDIPDEQHSEAARMLRVLTRLQDTARIADFLSDVSAKGLYGRGDNDALLAAARLLPPQRAAELIAQIVAANAPQTIGACADLLARAAAAPDGPGAWDLRPAATALVSALPGDPARKPTTTMWWRTAAPDAAVVVDTLTALGRIAPALADAAADYMLAWPTTYDADAVLVPALLRLHEQPATRDLPAVRHLRDVCLEGLRTRIALPLEPPRDWTRASALTCHCPLCSELSAFLADPSRRIWTIKTAEANRNHLQASITSNGCDLDVTTDRHGRPYALVCTKNQASYDRRATQRTADLDHLARLEQ